MEYILIPIAMKSEAEPFIKKLNNVETKNLFNYEIYIGKYDNLNIIVGISGIGTINMSGLMHVILTNYKINFVLNFGTVGGYGNSIHKGDIIVITECVNTNSFLTKKEEKGKGIKVENIEYVTFVENGEHKFGFYKIDENIMAKLILIFHNDKNIKYGRIGSGDMWNKEYDKIMYKNEKYEILCEDMECAAVFQVADKFKIPFASIKGISNNEILNEEYDYSVMNNLIKAIEKVLTTIKKDMGGN